MAATAGTTSARAWGIVAALFALAAVGAAGSTPPPNEPVPEPQLSPLDATPDADPEALRALAARAQRTAGERVARAPDVAAPTAAPLPGAEWNDPDSVNWADVPEAERGPLRDRLLERRGDRGPRPAGRLLERLRGEPRTASAGNRPVGDVVTRDAAAAVVAGWPEPVRVIDQLTRLAGGNPPVAAWATTTLAHVRAVRETAGPADPAAAAALLPLGDDVETGMTLAEGLDDAALATEVRRGALAVARRVAVWRAAAEACGRAGDEAAPGDVSTTFVKRSTAATTARLVEALERFESNPVAPAASGVHAAVAALVPEHAAVRRAVDDHYRAPNLRVAVTQALVARLLPPATVTSGPMQDFVLGRAVRGTRRVEQTLGVRFLPDPDEIRAELLVDGVVTSRTVAESGRVAVHSRATAEFLVHKSLTLSGTGLAFGRALGTATNSSRLADIQTDFDSVPIMGSLVRSIARNQHDEHHAEATREVNDKIVIRACREVDTNTEPKFRELAERVRTRVWEPLVRLGLEPEAVALETTSEVATARLRLAGAGQLAAHTPRPRAPADAVFSVQVHESSVNNACEGFGFAGRRLTVEQLVRTVCDRLGVPPRISDDLPADVEVAFAAEEPLRIECRDGLVHVRMSLDALESNRRAWYDVVAQVAYKPVIAGRQVFLEREGPVRLSGPGQQGRMEIALRTIVGKIFPKERPVPLLPPAIAADGRLDGVLAVQAVSTDGWIALALGQAAVAGGQAATPTPTAATPAAPARRVMRR